jgi:hypothetical protein
MFIQKTEFYYYVFLLPAIPCTRSGIMPYCTCCCSGLLIALDGRYLHAFMAGVVWPGMLWWVKQEIGFVPFHLAGCVSVVFGFLEFGLGYLLLVSTPWIIAGLVCTGS